jgi:hypothetical protein
MSTDGGETTTENTQKQSLINHFQLKFSTVKMHVSIVVLGELLVHSIDGTFQKV